MKASVPLHMKRGGHAVRPHPFAQFGFPSHQPVQ